jgi:5-methylcytosine-specific restriction endonuclease McrA
MSKLVETHGSANPVLRDCFRDPTPELYDAVRYLDAAVSAHLSGHHDLAVQLFQLANNPIIWAWTDSVWGKNSHYVTINKSVDNLTLPRAGSKEPARMPTSAQKRELHERDGYHCRFCGLPVVRSETRKRISISYPGAVPWGRTNDSQHAALQAMWAQYDHVVPHSHGGANTLDNLVVTCAACNFGRMSYTLQEVRLNDPRLRPPIKSEWDGLERFR